MAVKKCIQTLSSSTPLLVLGTHLVAMQPAQTSYKPCTMAIHNELGSELVDLHPMLLSRWLFGGVPYTHAPQMPLLLLVELSTQELN